MQIYMVLRQTLLKVVAQIVLGVLRQYSHNARRILSELAGVHLPIFSIMPNLLKLQRQKSENMEKTTDTLINLPVIGSIHAYQIVNSTFRPTSLSA